MTKQELEKLLESVSAEDLLSVVSKKAGKKNPSNNFEMHRTGTKVKFEFDLDCVKVTKGKSAYIVDLNGGKPIGFKYTESGGIVLTNDKNDSDGWLVVRYAESVKV